MIRGRFGDSSSAPYVAALIAIPDVARRNTSFLFDTGADTTVLMPMDYLVMGLNYASLKAPSVQCQGIGGLANGKLVQGFLTFAEEDDTLRTYKVKIIVMEQTGYNKDMISIIGRDIMGHWRFQYDYKLRLLDIQVDWAYLTTRKEKKKKPARRR